MTIKTVLLVEDQSELRELLRRALVDWGYNVLTAEDGRRGLAVINKQAGTIDMLVVDIVLPFVNGSELARVLSNQRPATKCLMMSGYNEVPSDVEKLQKLSKCRFIQKPFRLYELHTVVEEMLADGEGEATADTPQPSTAYPNPTPKRGG